MEWNLCHSWQWCHLSWIYARLAEFYCPSVAVSPALVSRMYALVACVIWNVVHRLVVFVDISKSRLGCICAVVVNCSRIVPWCLSLASDVVGVWRYFFAHNFTEISLRVCVYSVRVLIGIAELSSIAGYVAAVAAVLRSFVQRCWPDAAF